jgi:hypothetical protein
LTASAAGGFGRFPALIARDPLKGSAFDVNLDLGLGERILNVTRGWRVRLVMRPEPIDLAQLIRNSRGASRLGSSGLESRPRFRIVSSVCGN